MFDVETLKAIRILAGRIGVEPAALLAVVEVESGGKVYADIGGKQLPLIRWEGHYFDRRLTGKEREEARAIGLAHPEAGKIKNPKSQATRWRMLERAIEIDAVAALESTSWGVGQVMGANWEDFGFSGIDGLVNMARSGAAGQVELMVLFIEKNGLVDELRDKQWAAFARAYNGPGYRKNAYHTKMAEAYQRYSGRSSPQSDGMLRMGARGARVRELQALLARGGYAVKVDGDFGPATRDAVRAFQAKSGLTVDGVAGPETMRALDRYRQGAEEAPGAVRPSELSEVKGAGRGGVAIGLIVALRDQIAEAATPLLGIDSALAQTVANGLLGVAGVIGAGLAAWALLGWVRSRQTDEGMA